MNEINVVAVHNQSKNIQNDHHDHGRNHDYRHDRGCERGYNNYCYHAGNK